MHLAPHTLEEGAPTALPIAGTDTAREAPFELSPTIVEELRERGLWDNDASQALWSKSGSSHSNYANEDPTYPLVCYYISTSHNTYLLAAQLFGISSPIGYTRAISNGCRCVEIDAWDSDAGPIVNHGLTFSQSTSFQLVAQAIADSMTNNMWPLMVSLECHAGEEGQKAIVQIMKETWGSRLVDKRLEGIDGEKVSPKDLTGRILLIVEYYYPPAVEGTTSDSSSSSSSSSSSDEDSSFSFIQRIRQKHKRATTRPRIIPELASLGVYANSIKPKKGFLHKPERSDPLHQLVNISESHLSTLLPTYLAHLISRGTKHLFRIYPKGIRIHSNNFNPAMYWRAGGQISALNWQTFDLGMQINWAMFGGARGCGWALKPPELLGRYRRESNNRSAMRGSVKLTCEIIALSELKLSKPLPADESLDVFIHADLIHAHGDQHWRSSTVQASFPSSTPSTFQQDREHADAIWPPTHLSNTIEWNYDASQDLTFIRFVVVRNIKMAQDENLGVYCARVDRVGDVEAFVGQGLQAFELLDMSGASTKGRLILAIKMSASSPL